MARRLTILLIGLLFPQIIFAVDVTTVSLPLLALQQGQSGVVEAQIECAADGCSAFDIVIQFVPSVIQVDSIEIGPYLGEDVFTAENSIDNEAGTVQLAATALGDLPITEESVLLRLMITALEPGTSQLRITSLDVGDLIGNPLETISIDGGVVVTEGAIIAVTQPAAEITEAAETILIESAATEQPTCQYEIRAGDTLSGVALANQVTVEQLLEMNNITNPRSIVIGQMLIVPASNCRAAVTAGNIIEVHDCRHLGNNVFEWYSVRRINDISGNPISYIRIGGPYTGEWRPGCPAGEQPRTPSRRRSQGSGDDSGGTPDPDDTPPPPTAPPIG